jgi:mono/diheme cytochrome c family protein
MFNCKILLGTVVLIIFASTAVGEVVINKAALEPQDIANMGADEVFDCLCAVCHGTDGIGNGPAVSALDKGVPDLTVLSANNDGVYSHKDVEKAIFGRHRSISYGKVDMPHWGEQFKYAGGTSSIVFPRHTYAWNQIHTLTMHIESLQVVQVE